MTKDYEIIDSPQRISAIDMRGREICGAYLAEGHDYWSLFVREEIAIEITGQHPPPHHEHFWGCNGHVDSERWVEFIACLIVMAQRRGAA